MNNTLQNQIIEALTNTKGNELEIVALATKLKTDRQSIYKELINLQKENRAWVIVGRRGHPTRAGLGAPKAKAIAKAITGDFKLKVTFPGGITRFVEAESMELVRA